MKRLREELKVVPAAARVIAACLYIGVVVLLWTVAFPNDAETGGWPLWGRIVFSAGVPLLLSIWTVIIGYVYGDARRRGMRYVMWTFLAIFIPNAIGIILFFILRDPLPHSCPRCGRAVSSGFPFCPACGTALGPACPECHRTVEPDWAHCARCGAALQAAPVRPASH